MSIKSISLGLVWDFASATVGAANLLERCSFSLPKKHKSTDCDSCVSEAREQRYIPVTFSSIHGITREKTNGRGFRKIQQP